jgi:hypothetical protein
MPGFFISSLPFSLSGQYYVRILKKIPLANSTWRETTLPAPLWKYDLHSPLLKKQEQIFKDCFRSTAIQAGKTSKVGFKC